jgi:hypothetical protein
MLNNSLASLALNEREENGIISAKRDKQVFNVVLIIDQVADIF